MLNQFPLLPLFPPPFMVDLQEEPAIRSLLSLLSPHGENPAFSDVPHTLGAPAPNHLESPLDLAPVCQNSPDGASQRRIQGKNCFHT